MDVPNHVQHQEGSCSWSSSWRTWIWSSLSSSWSRNHYLSTCTAVIPKASKAALPDDQRNKLFKIKSSNKARSRSTIVTRKNAGRFFKPLHSTCFTRQSSPQQIGLYPQLFGEDVSLCTVFLPSVNAQSTKSSNLGFVWVLILVVSQKPGVGDNRYDCSPAGSVIKAIKSSAGNSTASGF